LELSANDQSGNSHKDLHPDIQEEFESNVKNGADDDEDDDGKEAPPNVEENLGSSASDDNKDSSPLVQEKCDNGNQESPRRDDHECLESKENCQLSNDVVVSNKDAPLNNVDEKVALGSDHPGDDSDQLDPPISHDGALISN